jgi:hypothetical protein
MGHDVQTAATRRRIWGTFIIVVGLATGLLLVRVSARRPPTEVAPDEARRVARENFSRLSLDRGETWRPPAVPRLSRSALGAKSEDKRPARFSPALLQEFTAQMDKPGFKLPHAFYAAEARREDWAVPMEKRLNERFAPDKLREVGLPTLQLDKVDCRSSSCQIEFSWTKSDLPAATKSENAARFGGDPLGLLTYQTGPLGALTHRIPPRVGDVVAPGSYDVRIRPDGRFAATEVILFGAAEIDPETYASVTEKWASRRATGDGRVSAKRLPRWVEGREGRGEDPRARRV